jgi:hypothetical protein
MEKSLKTAREKKPLKLPNKFGEHIKTDVRRDLQCRRDLRRAWWMEWIRDSGTGLLFGYPKN